MFSCFFGLKNVFPTIKILTFSRGEFKYVQMDQGLTKIFYFMAASQLVWLKVNFFIVVNMEYISLAPGLVKFFNWMMTDDVYDQHFFRKKS
jgi:hypothetical protein